MVNHAEAQHAEVDHERRTHHASVGSPMEKDSPPEE
jgi:hypothetical protein